MSKRPVEKQETVSAFYADCDIDISYYPELWYTFNVGHLMAPFARGLSVFGSKYWRVSWGKRIGSWLSTYCALNNIKALRG